MEPNQVYWSKLRGMAVCVSRSVMFRVGVLLVLIGTVPLFLVGLMDPTSNAIGPGMLMMCLGLPGALLTMCGVADGVFRYFRQTPPNHCRRCRYDLTGNESGRCPECGLGLSEPYEPKRRLGSAPFMIVVVVLIAWILLLFPLFCDT